MSIYGWTNEDGEPIMSGEAYRFEQALDADYADQRYLDDDDYDGPECPDCGDYVGDCDCADDDYDGPWVNEDAGMEMGLFGSEC
jgi:hypothetical protein